LAAVHASSFMSFVQLQVSLCSSQLIVPFSLQKQSETYICYTNKYKAPYVKMNNKNIVIVRKLFLQISPLVSSDFLKLKTQYS